MYNVFAGNAHSGAIIAFFVLAHIHPQNGFMFHNHYIMFFSVFQPPISRILSHIRFVILA